jgi:hypothetical protein
MHAQYEIVESQSPVLCLAKQDLKGIYLICNLIASTIQHHTEIVHMYIHSTESTYVYQAEGIWNG